MPTHVCVAATHNDWVRRTRTEVERFLRLQGIPDALIDDTIIIVGELVGNAVRHGLPPYEAAIVVADGQVTCRVTDRSPTVPSREIPTPADEHGRGVLLVEALADEWGVTSTADGKEVWARLNVGAA